MNAVLQLPITENSASSRARRLKIALVVHDLHSQGGHSLYTKTLADGFSRHHEVTVFANRCERTADANWSSQHVRAWRGTALATVKTFPVGLRSQAGALAKHQVRHAQGYCGGDPNVVTAHICVAAYLNSLQGLSLRHRLSLQLMAAAEEKFYRRNEGRVIAVSQKLANELREFYGVEGPVSVIPHGVESARFKTSRTDHRASSRRQWGIDESDTVAIYAGDLTKAHVYLKELARAAPQVKFVIVTSSQAYHWSSPNVRILPATNQLERYYAAADAFIFPTTYDAFGMVVLEAMASGLPVFTSDRAGAAELITTGSDGYVVPLDEWVETTAKGLGDQASLRKIGTAAEETASRHGWDRVVTEVEQVYFEVVQGT